MLHEDFGFILKRLHQEVLVKNVSVVLEVFFLSDLISAVKLTEI